jgi:hypothetical protein
VSKSKIDRLYEEGRTFPYGRNPATHPAPPRAERFHRHEEIQAPQHRENQHDNAGGKYDNDVNKKSWLQSGRATEKPFFDKGQDGKQAWRAGREKSNDWHSESDLRHPGEKGLPTKVGRIKP